MKVKIKSFSVDMDVKNSGVGFHVHNNDDNFMGKCYVTKTGLIWCKGKTRKENGTRVDWDEFIDWMNGE